MAQLQNIREIDQRVSVGVLGSKERSLKFDLNAFAELEKRFGSVDDAMKELEKGSMQAIRMILWAGLIHEEAVVDEDTGEPIKYNITPYQVGSWITPFMLKDLTEKLSKAIQLGLPESELQELIKEVPSSNVREIVYDDQGRPVLDPVKAEELKNADSANNS